MRRLTSLALTLAALACERSATAPTPPSLTIESAWTAPDSAVVGQRLPPTPAVRVLDAAGDPVSGVEVVFVPTLRAVPTDPYVATTDANGLATYAPGWILSGKLGRQELTAFPLGTTGVRIAFGVEATADTASQMQMTFGGLISLAIGDSVLPQFSFKDVFGNPTVSTRPIVYEFSDSTVLGSAGDTIVALAAGVSDVVARAGTVSAVATLTIGSFTPTLVVQRLAARSGFGIAIDPARVLYTVSIFDPGITRLDLVTEAPLPTIGAGTYWNVAYVPVRDEVWAVRYDIAAIDVFAAGSGAFLFQVPLPRLGLRLLPVGDGQDVYVTGWSNGLMRVHANDGSVEVVNVGDQVNGLAFGSDGTKIFTTSVGDGMVYEHDAATMAVLRSVHLGYNPQEILVDRLRGRLVVMREFESIVVLDESTLAPVMDSTPFIYGAYGATFTADGFFIVVTTLGGDVNVLDAATLESYGTLSALRSRRAAVDPGSGRVWVVQESAAELIRLTLTPADTPP